MRAGSCLVLLLLAGCAAPGPLRVTVPDAAVEQQARRTLREACPRGVTLTQRAIVNVAGRQFSCDGMVQIAADGGLRVALLAPMGIIAEVRVSPTGTVEVVKTAPGFRASWARQVVATTARWLFVQEETTLQFGRMADGRAVLWRGGAERKCCLYVFDAEGTRWEELIVAQGWRRLYRAERRAPGEFQVTAPGYEFDLRTLKSR